MGELTGSGPQRKSIGLYELAPNRSQALTRHWKGTERLFCGGPNLINAPVNSLPFQVRYVFRLMAILSLPVGKECYV